MKIVFLLDCIFSFKKQCEADLHYGFYLFCALKFARLRVKIGKGQAIGSIIHLGEEKLFLQGA